MNGSGLRCVPDRRRSLDLWQNYMTRNYYYYCFACQAACPVGKPARD